ncbi:hypothetical protein AJ79_05442 [Helicocarpus griseus UAMH5409]|uniref:Uncharacterized protein n=1 Tax=Helicocarpus griseus UAMH5409 TaxID=1447875 RepID=A0A2B7XFP1_9EURO|nr:hypothetical protein AJ79_05442 [Helicocarpus griseus UAMH5409]
MATKTQHVTSTTTAAAAATTSLPPHFTAHTSQLDHLIKPHYHTSSMTDAAYPYAPAVAHPPPTGQPSLFKRISNRLRLAYYRYEVTYGLYVMTPEEKMVANSFLVVFIALLIWALFLYFPPLLFQKLRRLVWILTGTDEVKETVTSSLAVITGGGNAGGSASASGNVEAMLSPTALSQSPPQT